MIESEWPRWVLVIPVLRASIFLSVFFHELAHHLQAKEGRRNASEKQADKRARRWLSKFLAKKYWYLVPFARLAGATLRLDKSDPHSARNRGRANGKG